LDQQNGGHGSSQSSVNNASRGRGGFSRGRRDHGIGGGNYFGSRGRGDPFNKPKNKFPSCQLCGKTNHAVFKCYKHFDPHYMGEEKSVNVTNSYGVDSNWYVDSSATDHGGDQIYTTNGSGMHIKHIGHSIIRTPHLDLKLNNILYVHKSSKNLASIHHIAFDNNVFFELYPDFFFIKDRESRRTPRGLVTSPLRFLHHHSCQASL
jgi:hypothetical protein